MSRNIKWFRDIGLSDVPQVGGKGANLGELTRAGIAVPPGFVVPVTTFEAFLEAVDPDGSSRAAVTGVDPDDVAALDELTAPIRERLRSAALPGHIEADIVAAYTEICGDRGDVPVAVRSSATSEDSEDASFAGLQDTYLWVRGTAAVIDNVRRCWASLYNTESVAYRLRLNLPENEVAMAVVVQEMVRSRTAGVMFTRSPTTGDRSTIVIESSWGFGSCLVSGEVTPDRFVISKVTGEITARTISTKLHQHVPASEAGDVRVEDVPAEKQSAPSLSDDELKKLTRIARAVEKHYGRPQDIEWAIAEGATNGAALYLLQSRPETVWAAKDKESIATPQKSAFDHVFAALGQRKS